MDSHCKNILSIFKNGENIEKAIISMDKVIYSSLTKILMENNTQHNKNLKTDGEETAKSILAKTLIIFRRQVKHRKVNIWVSQNELIVSKPGAEKKTDLRVFLLNLFILIHYIHPGRKGYENAQVLQKKMITGNALQRVNEFRDLVCSTLHQSGCTNNNDKEEIFNDCMLVFWQKVSGAEIGLFFKSDQTEKLKDCFVYNFQFYQNSKLSTYITGIAKNLFLSRLRSKSLLEEELSEKYERILSESSDDSTEDPISFLFNYYRNFVESRILRSIVSILQYDCGLEDNEVKAILGINNARIHSSRLRTHFHEWYEVNRNNLTGLIDNAHGYRRQQNEKVHKLNTKIKLLQPVIHDESKSDIDLVYFQEEFRSEKELSVFAAIFEQMFLFASKGKLSKLTGLQDEVVLKTRMITFKKHLFRLPEYQMLLWLFFYGSEEPESIIEHNILTFGKELNEQSESAASNNKLQQQILLLAKSGNFRLTDEIYNANNILFKGLLNDNNF